jgi:hypothetical protein
MECRSDLMFDALVMQCRESREVSASAYGPIRSSDTNVRDIAWLRPGLQEGPAFSVIRDGDAEFRVGRSLDGGIGERERSPVTAPEVGKFGRRFEAEEVFARLCVFR